MIEVTTDTFNVNTIPYLSSYMLTYKDAVALANHRSKKEGIYHTVVKYSKGDLCAITNYYSPQVQLDARSVNFS